MAHACELETSLYLAIQPELVQMDRAVREIPDWGSEHVWMDWNDGPLSVKGAVERLDGVGRDRRRHRRDRREGPRCGSTGPSRRSAEYIDELAVREPRPGRDHHDGTRQRAATHEGGIEMNARRLT